jgi:prolyl-tRNA synthetase
MGGKQAHEFMCLLDVGEDTIAVCASCGYAANVDIVGDAQTCARCDGSLAWKRGVEIGNIFQLGTRYTDALGVAVADAEGIRRSVIMGSYGIGVSRLLACLVERFHDERGIAMTAATAAMDAHLVVLGRRDDALEARASSLEREASARRVELLWDDRTDLSAGERLSDADLLGATVRVTMGRNTLAEGTVELRERRSGRVHTVSADSAVDALLRLRKDILMAECSAC